MISLAPPQWLTSYQSRPRFPGRIRPALPTRPGVISLVPMAGSQGSSRPPLEQLLERVASGDRIAFEMLYDDVIDVVFGLARKVIIDRDLASDVAQDVMVTLWESAGRFDAAKGSAMAWIATITRRRAIDVVRSREAGRRREEEQRPPATVPDPVGEQIVESAEWSAMRAALASLSDLQLQSISLAFFQGKTHLQISHELDVPLGTVKTRIRDGLLRLASRMEAFAGE